SFPSNVSSDNYLPPLAQERPPEDTRSPWFDRECRLRRKVLRRQMRKTQTL
ncbi:hypothetical protein JRQ81_000025, partial [Phrynocephalus forsythii]